MTRSERTEFERLLAPVQREVAGDHLGKQVMRAIRVFPDGRVMVQIEDEVGVPSTLHDIFDARGEFVESVRTEIPLATDVISAVRGDTLFTAGVDSLGVSHLMRVVVRD